MVIVHPARWRIGPTPRSERKVKTTAELHVCDAEEAGRVAVVATEVEALYVAVLRAGIVALSDNG
jgi:hypothetical protein